LVPAAERSNASCQPHHHLFPAESAFFVLARDRDRSDVRMLPKGTLTIDVPVLAVTRPQAFLPIGTPRRGMSLRKAGYPMHSLAKGIFP
jgi:hypothetical protein